MEHPDSYCALGRIFDEGLGVEVDHSAALKWFEKAADLGDADAQNIVGNCYVNGEYVKADHKKAFKYYQMSALQGQPYGMLNLAYCYANGYGIAANIEESRKWMEKAADAGVQEAIDFLNGNSQDSIDDSQQQSPQKENQNNEELIIDNVNVSTDGNKTLFIEFESEYYQDYEFDREIAFNIIIINGKTNKISSIELTFSGNGTQVSKNNGNSDFSYVGYRERFIIKCRDYSLKLRDDITPLTILIEAHRLDVNWTGEEDTREFPLVASFKTGVNLYYEPHIFGKSILEIRE